MNQNQGSKSKNIQDIYSLAPLQEGMLYYWLADKQSTVYVEQTDFTINGKIDIDIIEKSFNKIIRRYDILRTIFIYEKVKDPIQVVLKERVLKIQYRDLSQEQGDKDLIIEKFKEEDREKGFNLAKDLLLRITVFKIEEDHYILVWSSHHILMDGWCLGVLFGDLIRVYHSLLKRQPLDLKPVIPYSRYIAWLENQDKEEGLQYWKHYLEGIEKVSMVPGLTGSSGSWIYNGYRPGEYEFVLDASLIASLTTMVREQQVTLNTVFQAIWGLLLQRYNNTNDVVFGIVVSGRPPQLEGVEQIVGLFANTIPLRIKTGGVTDFSQLLRQIYQDTTLSKSYEYLSLAEIQSNCVLKNHLIHNIMSFENFPVETGIKDINQGESIGFKVTKLAAYGEVSYNFVITIIPGDRCQVKFSFNSLEYSPGFIEKIAGHFKEVVTQVIENAAVKLEDIRIFHHLAEAHSTISRDQYSGFEL